MDEVYSIVEGRFGTVEVREFSYDLIVHAHAHLQFCYWMGGGTAHTHVGAVQAPCNEKFVVGFNRYQSHDFKLDSPDAPAIVLLLNIQLPWLNDPLRVLGNPVELVMPQIVLTPQMRAAAWQLMQKTMAFNEAAVQSLEGDVLELLRLTIAQAALQMLPSTWPSRRKLIDYRLRLAIAYMHECAAASLTMSRLAKHVGLSRSRLYELFDNELHSSPKVIWNCIRMQRATQSVGFGSDDLATIAKTLGFSTAGNFSRFFRSNMGVSPLAYRKNNIQNKKRGAQLYSISYTSYAAQTLTQQDLDQIVKVAKIRNKTLGVTGVLLYMENCFMQYLEGSQRDLFEVLNFVTTATQHHQMHLGEFLPIQKRAYPDWSLAFTSTNPTEFSLALTQPKIQELLAMLDQRT